MDNWTNQWGNCSISSRNRSPRIKSHVTRRNGNTSINIKLESWTQLEVLAADFSPPPPSIELECKVQTFSFYK